MKLKLPISISPLFQFLLPAVRLSKASVYKIPARLLLVLIFSISSLAAVSQQTNTQMGTNQTDPFKISPNPTNGEVFISGLMEKVEIYDVLGKKVFETNKISFDISELEAGVYLIKVTHNNKGTVKRLIKN